MLKKDYVQSWNLLEDAVAQGHTTPHHKDGSGGGVVKPGVTSATSEAHVLQVYGKGIWDLQMTTE